MLLRRLGLFFVILLLTVSCSGGNGNDPSSKKNNDELNLAEANVTAVRYDAGSGRFDVTLIHDDDGESGYADAWQVEKLDGTVLGRRDLLHAHGTREFTRSHVINVPGDVDWVVVRGHDQAHGYGGQAIVFNVKTGEQTKVDQGEEPMDFSRFPDMDNPG